MKIKVPLDRSDGIDLDPNLKVNKRDDNYCQVL